MFRRLASRGVAARMGQRTFATAATNKAGFFKKGFAFAAGSTLAFGAAAGATCLCAPFGIGHPPFDYKAVKADIEALLEDKPELGPLLVRLAWHEAGTWDSTQKNGSPNSASMRFHPECAHAANNGLAAARNALEPIKQKHAITYADLWSLTGCLAIEQMGGPHIPWRWGRPDAKSSADCAPDGRLPDATKGASHIRDVFGRMGFTDDETVALIGAHTLGHCHDENSGFEGPWNFDPLGFDNSFFTDLLQKKWVINKDHAKNLQYMDEETGRLMMLPTDMALVIDPEFKKTVELFSASQSVFFSNFAPAFQKLMELGVSDRLFDLP